MAPNSQAKNFLLKDFEIVLCIYGSSTQGKGPIVYYVFGPANGCSIHHFLVKIIFFSVAHISLSKRKKSVQKVEKNYFNHFLCIRSQFFHALEE